MKTELCAIVLFSVAVSAVNADPATDARVRVAIAISMASSPKRVEQAAPRTTPNANAISQWLSQPLNHGNCPCGATGQGCHCQPHSDCAGGNCSAHNPLLQQAKGVSFGPTPSVQTPSVQTPQVQFALPQYQSGCLGGNCPNSGSSQGWYPGKLLRGGR